MTSQAAEPRLRYELVPLHGAEDQANRLPPGSTVTVTSSPRRGLEPTVQLCHRLASKGFNAVPHISARLVKDASHLQDVTSRLREMGVREVFVVGGDSARPTGRFDSAFSLLRAAAESGPWFERVGIAGYPERHPLIEDRVLFQALLDKQPFAAYVVTQICFDARAIERWIHGARREGLRLPVYVGMPGLVTRAKLLEIALRIGVGDSLRYARKQGGLVARLVGRGAYRPNELVAALSSALRNGTAAGIHINTFNQVEATMRWVRGVLGRDGWWDIGLATEEPPA